MDGFKGLCVRGDSPLQFFCNSTIFYFVGLPVYGKCCNGVGKSDAACVNPHLSVLLL